MDQDELTEREASALTACSPSCPHCGKVIEPPQKTFYASFFGGAAHRTILDLAAVPMTLRVVIDQFGNVDALDQPGDEVREGEKVHLYKRAERLGWIHYKENFDPRQTEGGFITAADYFPANAHVEGRPEPDNSTAK